MVARVSAERAFEELLMLSVALTLFFVPVRFRTLSESETAVSDFETAVLDSETIVLESETAVSESETTVSESESAVSESEWVRKTNGYENDCKRNAKVSKEVDLIPGPAQIHAAHSSVPREFLRSTLSHDVLLFNCWFFSTFF